SICSELSIFINLSSQIVISLKDSVMEVQSLSKTHIDILRNNQLSVNKISSVIDKVQLHINSTLSLKLGLLTLNSRTFVRVVTIENKCDVRIRLIQLQILINSFDVHLGTLSLNRTLEIGIDYLRL